MIRSSELSKLAYKHGVSDKTIEKDYILTWLLFAISESPLCLKLAFKGGTALKNIYLYIGPLLANINTRFIKVDFSRDEELVFPPERHLIVAEYSDCINRSNPVLVYTLEEITIEKIRSLLTRTEPRDLFDVHYLLTNRLVDMDKVAFHIHPKFTAKGLAVSELRTILEKRQTIFERLWEKRLIGQIPDVPPLETSIRETNRIFLKYF